MERRIGKNSDYEPNNNKIIDPNITKKYEDRDTLFSRAAILKKTEDNMAKAEALTDEQPLRTEKTAELERREREEES